MALHFLALSLDWYGNDLPNLCKQIDMASGTNGVRVSGVYDYVLFMDENDRTIISEKIDKIRKITGVKHTLHLIGVEKIEY